MDKLMKVFALILLLSFGGCELLEEQPEPVDEFPYFVMALLVRANQNQYCQGLGIPPITLTVGVVSPTINTYEQCFIVDTSGPVTIQVTTVGVNTASIGLYIPYSGGVSSDDPSITISTAQIGVQFLVSMGAANYTVLVN